jgi:hypothetical protein
METTDYIDALLVSCIGKFIGANDKRSLHLIKQRKILIALEERCDSCSNECATTVRKAIYWAKKPLQLRIHEPSFSNGGKTKKKACVIFELYDGLMGKPDGWNDKMYPPPSKISSSLYREAIDRVYDETGFAFQRGCNEFVSIYEIPKEQIRDEYHWKEIRKRFIDSLASLGYPLNLLSFE